MMRIKLVLGKEMPNIIRAYASQIELEEDIVKEFWKNGCNYTMKIDENLIIGGDLKRP